MWNLEAILPPAITAVIGGLIGSLLGPWIKWDIEKRRQRQVSRRELVSIVRVTLASNPPTREEFVESPLYAQLLPHLSSATLERLQSRSTIVQMGGRGGGVNNYVPGVLDDLFALERKWKLL